MNYSWLSPGRYLVDDSGVARKAAPPKRLVAQGWACHYGVEHTNFKNDLREIFLPGCFTGSLFDVEFRREHILTEAKMADQADGDLIIHDSLFGLAVRACLTDETLAKIDDRRELSVGYVVLKSSYVGGIRVIEKAALFEVSCCNTGAVQQTWLEIRDANDVGPLETDCKHWGYEGAALGFTRALGRL